MIQVMELASRLESSAQDMGMVDGVGQDEICKFFSPQLYDFIQLMELAV
jgi:hypothetical protein